MERSAAKRREAAVEDEEATPSKAARVLVGERAVEQQRDERHETRTQAERARGHVRRRRGRAHPDADDDARAAGARVRARVVRRLEDARQHPDEDRVKHLRAAHNLITQINMRH